MTFARNPIDGVRTYFEDEGGPGPPLIMFVGLMDPIASLRDQPLAEALRHHARLIFVDHRGHGLSDRPHAPASYALNLRVGDAIAVLDELGLERAHFLGLSWGARLAFAIAEQARDRVASLIAVGNQPYAWDPDWPLIQAASNVIDAGPSMGMGEVLRRYEAVVGRRLRDDERSWMLDNDPMAIAAAWSTIFDEGPISTDLTLWRLPVLIIAGEGDDMFENARKASQEIPGARFVAMPGLDHFTSAERVQDLLPEVLRMLSP